MIPNQSAARGTRLKLMFRRAIKTVRKVPEEGKEEMRVALEIRIVCGQKDQAQHPKGTRKRDRRDERKSKSTDNQTSRQPEETEARERNTRKEERHRSTRNKKGHEEPKHNSTKGREERTKKGKVKPQKNTPSVPISMARRVRARSQGPGGNKGKIGVERY